MISACNLYHSAWHWPSSKYLRWYYHHCVSEKRCRPWCTASKHRNWFQLSVWSSNTLVHCPEWWRKQFEPFSLAQYGTVRFRVACHHGPKHSWFHLEFQPNSTPIVCWFDWAKISNLNSIITTDLIIRKHAYLTYHSSQVVQFIATGSMICVYDRVPHSTFGHQELHILAFPNAFKWLKGAVAIIQIWCIWIY